MDSKTRSLIRRMQADELTEYLGTIRTELEHAEAKRLRLANDVAKHHPPKDRDAKRRKLRRLDLQITTLGEILDFARRLYR